MEARQSKEYSLQLFVFGSLNLQLRQPCSILGSGFFCKSSRNLSRSAFDRPFGITKSTLPKSHTPISDQQTAKNIPKPDKTNVGILDPNGIYAKLRKELDIYLGKSVIDQKTKYTYRSQNEIGYSNKKELDMISLFKPTMNASDQVRFRIYPYILASHTGLKNADEIIKVLPEGSVTKQERENPHLGDIFIEGVFSNDKEIEKFLKWILFGKD